MGLRRRNYKPPCPLCGKPVRVWRIPPYYRRMEAQCEGCAHRWWDVISQVDRGREELLAGGDGSGMVYSFGVVPRHMKGEGNGEG